MFSVRFSYIGTHRPNVGLSYRVFVLFGYITRTEIWTSDIFILPILA